MKSINRAKRRWLYLCAVAIPAEQPEGGGVLVPSMAVLEMSDALRQWVVFRLRGYALNHDARWVRP